MSKVDLFIPIYNRPLFLKRILSYYQLLKVDYRIIIADSSFPENKKKNKKIALSFSKLDILYLDKFSPSLNPHHKFGQMIKYAKAKYCVFCADDDFVIPSGIKIAVDFLEKNPSYVVAHGSYISFYLYKGPLGYRFWWRFIYPFKPITSSNSLNRLLSHLLDYYQVLYAVRRTETVKMAYKEFIKSKTNPILFGELMPDMLTLIYGKMKRLDCFYGARQAFSTSYSYWPSLIDATNDGTYDAEYSKFRNSLALNVSKTSKVSKQKAAEMIDLNMKQYLKTTYQDHLMGRVNLILRKLPKFIDNGLRILHVQYLFSKPTQDKIGLINNPNSKFYPDFETIRNLVINNK